VYYEIEERDRRGDVVNVDNSLTVFEFNGERNIRFGRLPAAAGCPTDRWPA
jgi:hypothetical protein